MVTDLEERLDALEAKLSEIGGVLHRLGTILESLPEVIVTKNVSIVDEHGAPMITLSGESGGGAIGLWSGGRCLVSLAANPDAGGGIGVGDADGTPKVYLEAPEGRGRLSLLDDHGTRHEFGPRECGA